MSTKAQVAQLVRPFLERHQEFELVGRSIVLRPVGHIMRSFFIDRASIKAYIQPSWRVEAMFYPPPKYTFSIHDELPRGVGYVDRPETQERLLEEMELAAATILIPNSRIEQMPGLAAANAIPGFPHKGMTIALAALGQYAEAAKNLAAQLEVQEQSLKYQVSAAKAYKASSRAAKFHEQVIGKMLDSRKLWMQIHSLIVSEDAASIATLLHSWEAAAVKKHGVEHLWQPSPFPFEMSDSRNERGAGD